MQSFTRLSVFLAFSFFLTAKPVIYPRAVISAASYLPNGLPGSAIAQGSLFAIFGTGLGPAQGLQQPSFPLQTILGGVSVQVKQGSTSVNAIPVYVADGQINVLMPSNAPLGMVAVYVTFGNQVSNPSPVQVVRDGPGILTILGTGIGPAIIQNVTGPSTVSLNSVQDSAKPGQTEVLYLTGLGPITAPDNQPPPAATL